MGDSIKYGMAFVLNKQGVYDSAVSNTVLLIRNYTDSTWNTIPINPPNSKYYTPLGTSIKCAKIIDNKVYMNFVHSTNTDTMLHRMSKTELIIYDLLTEEYTCVQIPPELIVLSAYDDPLGQYGTTYPRYNVTTDYIVAMNMINNNILAILLQICFKTAIYYTIIPKQA
jgi:hypothetical protein